MSNKNSYLLIFVCNSGEIELKCILLALSLHKSKTKNIDTIVKIPDNYLSLKTLSQNTLQLFSKLNIKIEYFSNGFLTKNYNYSDLISNKIYALQNISTNYERILFVDSDMLLLKPFDDLSSEYDFLGVKANKSHINNWKDILKHFNINSNKMSYKTLFDNDLVPPYFNSGFISLASDKKDAFCNDWLNYYIYLRKNPDILNDQIHFADQVSISLTLLNDLYTFGDIDVDYNYPLKFLPLKDNNPYLVHYHNPKILFSNSFLTNMVKSFIDDNNLSDIVNKYPLWNYYSENGISKYLSLLKYYLKK